MPHKRNNPGCACCCCDESAVISDSCESLGAWSAESGIWSVSGGAIQTSDDNAILLHNTAGPDAQSVAATMTAGYAYGAIRIYLKWQDANNHLYAQWQRDATQTFPNQWRQEAHEVVDGVDTTLKSSGWKDVPMTDGLFFGPSTVAACYSAGTLVLSPNSIDQFEVAVSDPTALGNRVGIGTGTTAGESVDGFAVYRSGADCPSCSCTVCQFGTGVNELNITLAGVAAIDTCTDCSDWNGTFTATTEGAKTNALSAGGGNKCRWEVDASLLPVPCSTVWIAHYRTTCYVRLVQGLFGQTNRVLLVITIEWFASTWEVIQASADLPTDACGKTDCATALDGLALQVDSYTPPSDSEAQQCDFSAISITLSVAS